MEKENINLQQPEFVFMNGKLTPWNEAKLHIGCEAVNRGLNVFEGLKGYWQEDGRFGIIEMQKHYDRLRRSAKLLQIPWFMSYEDFRNNIFLLIGRLIRRDKDLWFRTTLFVVEGHWGVGTKADLVITAYNQDKKLPEVIKLGVSSWQRSSDISLPTRIKTSSNYQVGRLARIEGRAKGCQDMVLLNSNGRVAETSGSCILLVRDGVIYTPPASEGTLESITLDIVERLAKSAGIKFVKRPIDRTELIIADELTICGTLSELVPVESIDDNAINPNGPLFSLLRKSFFDIVRGRIISSDIEFEYLPDSFIFE